MSRFSFLRSDRQAPAPGKARGDYAADEDLSAVAAAPKRSSRQKDAADPALPEKKRARRRLAGAITLTLAAVIVLPLIFDPEPKPVSQDIAIDVSSRNKAVQPAKSVAPEPVPETQAAAASAQPAAPAAAIAAVAGTAAAVAIAKPSSTPAEAKPAAPAPKPAAKPASETKSAAGQGKYIVQVAALASQKKVDELRTKLKSSGIKSHTQKVATKNGERIRVRIGPLGTRKEADGMCAKLGKIGQQCKIIPA